MSRPLGSPNQQAIAVPDTINLSTQERIEFLAALIVERIIEDRANGHTLLKTIGGGNVSGTTAHT